jgi:hypothetical protein
MQSADVQQAVHEEVQSRLAKATADLARKYASGKGGDDESEDGPTGSAYREKQLQDIADRKAKKALKKEKAEDTNSQAAILDEDDDAEDDEEDDADFELRQIREQRLKQLKSTQREKIENIGKGHGQYRMISQDEFLAEVTSSQRVICLFFHRDFPRCEIMHHHLQKLATRHIESKFIKIDAEKALFFVDKV